VGSVPVGAGLGRVLLYPGKFVGVRLFSFQARMVLFSFFYMYIDTYDSLPGIYN
jgi:hypothetical protein